MRSCLCCFKCWICRKNESLLFVGPFGSDTSRYDMHCMCHSTSICHSWGPFFTFRPLPSILFMKSYPKAVPILHTLKHKNIRMPSHRASQKLSRRSFGSKLNFVVSIFASTWISMDFHTFPLIKHKTGWMPSHKAWNQAFFIPIDRSLQAPSFGIHERVWNAQIGG